MSKNTFISDHYQEQSKNWRNDLWNHRIRWMPICYVEPGRNLSTGWMFAVLLEVHI
jgi:hypothetical protein